MVVLLMPSQCCGGGIADAPIMVVATASEVGRAHEIQACGEGT
jgi:hypothetical protein